MQAMDTAGAIAGPLIALLLVTGLHRDIRTVFWVAAIPGLLSIVVVALFATETRKKAVPAAALGSATNPHADVLNPGDLVRNPPAIPGSFYFVITAVGLFSLGASSDMFLVLRAQELGVAVAQAPLLGLVFNVVYTLASWPAGKLSDRVSKPLIAAAGYLVYAVTYAAFATALPKPFVWVMMGFYGLFYALTSPVLRALIAATVPPAVRGRALGIYYFVSSISMLLASVLTGTLWSWYGAALPLGLCGGLAFIAALMLIVHHFRSATRG